MQSYIQTFLLGCVTLFYGASSAQEVFGTVLDVNSKSPIGYVNIGVVGKNIGTVSDQEGSFQLSLAEAKKDDILRWSFVGYESFEMGVEDLHNISGPLEIDLKPKVVSLKAITITSSLANPRILGVPKRKCYPIPLYRGVTSNVGFPQQAYRHELGTRFENNQTTQIDKVQFHFIKYQIDTLDFRINIYAYKDGEFVSVLKKPLYLFIANVSKSTPIVVDLSDRKIVVDSDFLITLENYKKIPDNALQILTNFKSAGERFPTYFRSHTQSHWLNSKYKSRDYGLSILAYVH